MREKPFSLIQPIAGYCCFGLRSPMNNQTGADYEKSGISTWKRHAMQRPSDYCQQLGAASGLVQFVTAAKPWVVICRCSSWIKRQFRSGGGAQIRAIWCCSSKTAFTPAKSTGKMPTTCSSAKWSSPKTGASAGQRDHFYPHFNVDGHENVAEIQPAESNGPGGNGLPRNCAKSQSQPRFF